MATDGTSGSSNVSKMSTGEWIVIIAVLAILVVIVGAALRPSGEEGSASRFWCVSNLHRLAVGMLEYTDDHDDRLPPRDVWSDAILPVTGDPSFAHCPAVKGPGLFGYAFNSRLGLSGLSGIPDPSAVPLIYDSVNLGANASDPVSSIPARPRHGRVNNMAYLDGFAGRVRPGNRTR